MQQRDSHSFQLRWLAFLGYFLGKFHSNYNNNSDNNNDKKSENNKGLYTIFYNCYLRCLNILLVFPKWFQSEDNAGLRTPHRRPVGQ